MTFADLEQLLTESEGDRIEFKEARSSYQFDKLVDYCAALANEGGGRVVLGATDRRPRSVVGTKAFEEPGRAVSGLMERLRVRVTVFEIFHPTGRVLVFEVAPRPLGMPIEVNGRYLARSGDILRPMRPVNCAGSSMSWGATFPQKQHRKFRVQISTRQPSSCSASIGTEDLKIRRFCRCPRRNFLKPLNFLLKGT